MQRERGGGGWYQGREGGGANEGRSGPVEGRARVGEGDEIRRRPVQRRPVRRCVSGGRERGCVPVLSVVELSW